MCRPGGFEWMRWVVVGNLFKQQSFLDTGQLKTEAAYPVVGFVCMCVFACVHACVCVCGEGGG